MNFEEFTGGLKRFIPEKIVFVALGNVYRGDDRAGLLFLYALMRKEQFKNSRFINAGINPENYLSQILFHEPSAVVFIDSVRGNNNPGIIEWIEENKMDSLQISTHAFSIRLIAEYLQKSMPVEVKFLGISMGPATFGQEISQAAIDSIKKFFRNS
ncbi:MAG: hydrogenase maturation protease [Acidobacteriota bacterium]